MLGRSAGWIVVQVEPVQLGAGGDAELGVDLVQVVADRVGAQEQPLSDLLVAQPLGGQVGDLELLGVSRWRLLGSRVRAVSPLARNSSPARSAQGVAPSRS